MRGKKARALRKLARELTVGLPERRLLETKVHNVKYAVLERKTHNLMGGFNIIDDGVRRVSTFINDPNTTRGRYLILKQQARA